MILAVAVWNGRVSPVFDHSQRLLLVEAREGGRLHEREETLDQPFPLGRVARLRELRVNTLICGAVSKPLATLISASGIRVIAFTAGEVGDVVEAFLSGGLPGPAFWMPGCGRGHGPGRRRFRRGRREGVR